MKNVCVYCGSRDSNNEDFPELAGEMGRRIARKNWGLVYGGGKVGMMGKLADGALMEGGEVIGVIPTALKRLEVAHTGVSEMYETPDMHTRKAKMEQLSDVFLVLPGGFGTLDEFFEILTWRQLGIHQKPIVLLNADNYFKGLLDFARRSVELDYVRQESLDLFTVTETADECLDVIHNLLNDDQHTE